MEGIDIFQDFVSMLGRKDKSLDPLKCECKHIALKNNIAHLPQRSRIRAQH